ncbi:MAG: hypothetical protein LBM93_14150 [Oscillospiraceae bacterium]|jgi:hypothetical protein|nr:hypothetical protein [Oscillospiraceae bacterium]
MFKNPENFSLPFFNSDFRITKEVALYEFNRIKQCVKNLIKKNNAIDGYEILFFLSMADKDDYDESNLDEYIEKTISAVFRLEEIMGIDNDAYGESCFNLFELQYKYYFEFTKTMKIGSDIYVMALTILSFIAEIEKQKTLELNTTLRDKICGIETMYAVLIYNREANISLIIELRRLFGAAVLILLSITTSTGTYFDNMQEKCPANVNLNTAKKLVLKAVEQVKEIVDIPTIKLPNGVVL